MNKREFLAMGGAVPLMLAGCGSGSGSAPVRLVNASVGYPHLGFMVESTQATSADVSYGNASPFEGVEAGSVDVTLTVSNSTTGGNDSATAAQTRTINKDTRYSLVAYGYADQLKSVLLAESTTTPDTGKANINVLNTSVDIGAVDVYLSTTTDLSVSTLIASSITGVSQSAFSGMVAGSYYITVVGAGSVAKGISDVRFQSSTALTLTALEIVTIILTPGTSGVLANAIILIQGTAAASAATTSELNTTARIRAVTATGGMTTQIVGANSAGTAVTVMASSNTSQYSNYVVVATGTPPTVTVNGATITPFMYASDGVTQTTATLTAGGDYTMMVYTNSSGAAVAQLITDNNTAPVAATGVKFRLVNLAYNSQALQLSMSVNSISVASLIPYATASAYTEVSTPQTVASTAQVFNGTKELASVSQVMLLDNIFTDFVLSIDSTTGLADNIFRSASGT